MWRLFFIPQAFGAEGVITSAPRLVYIFTNVLTFLLSIVGVLGIISLGISGVFYFFSVGDERRVSLAKRASLASVVGMLIALGAWVIVNQLTMFFL
ncbi:MAG: hypothetical protein ACSLEX_03345 [Minisyncoccota bacterium]